MRWLKDTVEKGVYNKCIKLGTKYDIVTYERRGADFMSKSGINQRAVKNALYQKRHKEKQNTLFPQDLYEMPISCISNPSMSINYTFIHEVNNDLTMFFLPLKSAHFIICKLCLAN